MISLCLSANMNQIAGVFFFLYIYACTVAGMTCLFDAIHKRIVNIKQRPILERQAPRQLWLIEIAEQADGQIL